MDGTGAADDPVQQLVGFAKVAVKAGSTASATVHVDPRWASHWDVSSHAWAVRPGERQLRIGTSSRSFDHILTVPASS